MEGYIRVYDGGVIKKRFGNNPNLLYFCHMILLISTITILLVISRKYFPLYKSQINTGIILLSIWLLIGISLRVFLGEKPSKRYSDVEMAQNLIKDDKEFKKAKMKVLDDGSVRISIKRKKYLLKDGVLTTGK